MMKTIITLSAAIALSLATNMNVAFGGGWGANNGDRAQMRQTRVERILERFDANQDGQITLEEVRKVRIAHFVEMDADEDNLVSFAEFESFKAAKQQERQAQNAEKAGNKSRRGRKHGCQRDAGSRFANLDINGDEQLSIDEFTAQVRIFDKFDANNDGVITTEELNQRPQRRRQ
jgi:hypothetical protein